MTAKEILTSEQRFCLEGCGTYNQYAQLRHRFETDAHESDSCSFCNLDRELNQVEWENEYAMAWHVPPQFKRPELRIHYLIVPKRHVRFVYHLTDAEVLSMHQARKYMATKYNYLGGMSHTREGPMYLNSGTVPHLHENCVEVNCAYITSEALLQSCSGNDSRVDFRVPVVKDPRDREKNRVRAAEFACRYEQEKSVVV